MAQRKKPAPAAPWLIRAFWGLAILVAMVLGPLLLIRAEWMWGSPSAVGADSRSVDPSNEEAPQIRLKLDLLAGKPWVIHVVALSSPRSESAAPVIEPLQSCLGAEAGWDEVDAKTRSADVVSTDPIPAGDRSYRDRKILKTQVERDGAENDLFLILETWPAANRSAATRSFLEYAEGLTATSIHLESEQVPLEAGGRAHLIVFLGDPDVQAREPNPSAIPNRNARPRVAIVIPESATPTDLMQRIASFGALPLAVESVPRDSAACALVSGARLWFDGGTIAQVQAAIERHRQD